MLFFSDSHNRGKKTAGSVPLRDVLVIGVAQAFATIPGLSRSGTTVSVGCFLGLDRRFALRYSFLMSIPAVLGANILNLKDIMATGAVSDTHLDVYKRQAFDCDGMFLVGACADLYNPKTVRATMGALFRRPVWRCAPAQAKGLLSTAGIPLLGAALRSLSLIHI